MYNLQLSILQNMSHRTFLMRLKILLPNSLSNPGRKREIRNDCVKQITVLSIQTFYTARAYKFSDKAQHYN